MLLRVSFFIIFMLCVSSFIAQPVNDDPCGAIELVIENGQSCLPAQPFQWTNATPTAGLSNPSCGSYSTGDVWFYFTLTEAADLFITSAIGNGGNAIDDGAMELYYTSGDCMSTFVRIVCNDDNGPGNMPQIELRSYPAGQYYIRFWDYEDKVSGHIGGICIAAMPVVATTINDDPCSAIPLQVIDGDQCTPVIPVEWMGASAFPLMPNPLCGSYMTGDVWFSFAVIDTVDVVISTAEGTGQHAITDGALAVYRADDCNGVFTLLHCQDDQGPEAMPAVQLINVMPGNYFIRFWDTADSINGNIGGICVAAQPTIAGSVENDDPCGAIELSVVQDTSCTPDNPQSWLAATHTIGIANPVCGSYSTGDVWYTFTLMETSDIVINTIAGTGLNAITDGAMQYYAASACDGAFTGIRCSDDDGEGNMPMIVDYAVPAGKYYIRFWEYNDAVSGNIDGICVAAQPSLSPVPNDHCISAIQFPDLPLNGDCVTINVQTEGATGHLNTPCGGTSDDDVWYSFTVPQDITRVSYRFTKNNMPVSQIIQLFTDQCGVGNAGCYTESEGVFDNLMAGHTYFIRTFTAQEGSGDQYDLCLKVLIPPAFDEPCGAMQIPVLDMSADCVPDNPVSWEFATASAVNPPGCGSYANGDIWFSFELTEKSDIRISTKEGDGPQGIVDGAMSIYRADEGCQELIQIGCEDDQDVQANLLMPQFFDYAFLPGTYLIRLWDYNDAISGNIGGICVAAQPSISQLDHDICTGAISFPPIPVDGTCSEVMVTTLGATGSDDTPDFGYSDDDVWYRFVVPDGVNRLQYEITTHSGSVQHAVCLYAQCGFIVSPDCHDTGTGILDGLVGGEEFFLQVYTVDRNTSSNFTICLRTPPSPPVNDRCDQAIAFGPINVDGTCTSVFVNTTWSTPSPEATCRPDEHDLWYTFVVPENVTHLLTEFIPDSRFDAGGFELYSGVCGQLTSIYCYENHIYETAQMYDLTAGETYYIRVFTGDPRLFEFEFCLKTPPPAPANDECPDAAAFPPIPTDGGCVTMTANTNGATGNNTEDCSWVYDDDVWFSFIVPDGTSGVWIELQYPHSLASGTFSIYEGTCENPVFISCAEDDRNMYRDLVPGNTYFLRVFTALANVQSEFDVCIGALPMPPANDECSGAILFPEIPVDGSWVSAAGSTLAATTSLQDDCNGFGDDDVWFSFVMPAGQDKILFDYGDQLGIVLELYEGNCEDLTFLDCFGSANSSGGISGLIPGQTYYWRVYTSYENDFQSFSISMSIPLAEGHDDCVSAWIFPDIPVDGSCASITFHTAFANPSGIPNCYDVVRPDNWFQFTVPEPFTSVTLDIDVLLGYSLNIQVFEGSCDDLAYRECLFFPQREDISGLTPGATYWLQVMPTDANSTGQYHLCMSVTPLPHANDHCEQSSSLTSAPGILVDLGVQTTAGATASGIEMCYPYAPENLTYDVWYSFVTDQDGGDATFVIHFEEPPLIDFSFFNLNAQVFAGQCDELTTLACVENDFGVLGYENTFIEIELYGLMPETQYFLRVFPTGSSGNYAEVDFTIEAYGSAFEPIVGISDPDDTPEAMSISRIYPSPATSMIHVEFEIRDAGPVQLSVVDVNGRIWNVLTESVAGGLHSRSIPVHHLPPGMYVMSLQQFGKSSIAKRFIKE